MLEDFAGADGRDVGLIPLITCLLSSESELDGAYFRILI